MKKFQNFVAEKYHLNVAELIFSLNQKSMKPIDPPKRIHVYEDALTREKIARIL